MSSFPSRRITSLLVVVATLGSAALPARAEPFQYSLSGAIYGASLGTGVTTNGTPIPDSTPFTETALFDTSSPNLVDISGLAIHVPSQAAITLGGVTYQIAPYSASQPFGVGIAIFDRSSPFPVVPEYAVALIGNPILGGADILGDFTTATPDFTVSNPVTATFPASGSVGAGIFGGICVDPDTSNCGSPYITQITDFATGDPVVVFTTTGPGLTNALTGLMAARDEGARIIVLSGCTAAAQRGLWPIQETGADTIPAGTFHMAATLDSAETLPPILVRLAYGLARQGGFLAHLALPTAAQASRSAASPVPPLPQSRGAEAPSAAIADRAPRCWPTARWRSGSASGHAGLRRRSGRWRNGSARR